MTLLVLFDIDGTLLRAGDPAHARAMRDALEEIAGEAIPLDGIPLAGMLDREIARLALERHGLDTPTVARLLPRIMQRMGERYQQLVRRGEREAWVLPGVRELIRHLRARGHVVGVVTGNAEAVARAKLAAADLDQLLPFGAYGDQADERHELVRLAREEARRRYRLEIPLSQTILVGDTPRDIAAAHASGARILAVATGRFGAEELLELGADSVLPDLSDTERALALLETIAVDRRSDR